MFSKKQDGPSPLKVVGAHTNCASCGVPAHRESAICGSCGKSVAEPGPPSYFVLLGLRELYRVDSSALEAAFHGVSRLVHPDRYAAATPLERRLATQRSTLLNDAYRTLRDPVKRAVYLLQRAGAQVGEETGTHDPDLLGEVMEGRERVDELKDALRAGAPRATDDLAALRAEVDEKLRALHETLEAEFGRYDAGVDREAVTRVLHATVERLRYFGGIRAQLDHLSLQCGQVV